ncbi:MAG: hypothetical protein M1820_003931 [Bogoriella megaspora]|nr:MAG: hypothetical protein M1820_003931 [Bogoriella megaspora]
MAQAEQATSILPSKSLGAEVPAIVRQLSQLISSPAEYSSSAPDYTPTSDTSTAILTVPSIITPTTGSEKSVSPASTSAIPGETSSPITSLPLSPSYSTGVVSSSATGVITEASTSGYSPTPSETDYTGTTESSGASSAIYPPYSYPSSYETGKSSTQIGPPESGSTVPSSSGVTPTTPTDSGYSSTGTGSPTTPTITPTTPTEISSSPTDATDTTCTEERTETTARLLSVLQGIALRYLQPKQELQQEPQLELQVFQPRPLLLILLALEEHARRLALDLRDTAEQRPAPTLYFPHAAHLGVILQAHVPRLLLHPLLA